MEYCLKGFLCEILRFSASGFLELRSPKQGHQPQPQAQAQVPGTRQASMGWDLLAQGGRAGLGRGVGAVVGGKLQAGAHAILA